MLPADLPTELAATLVDGVPQWERIDFEVECSRCGYNLRMLPAPRCPECGLEFEWADALFAHRYQSTALFEHQWRKRPLRSLISLFSVTFRPSRFWRSVSIHLRIVSTPLRAVWLAAIVFSPLISRLALLVGWGAIWGLILWDQFLPDALWQGARNDLDRGENFLKHLNIGAFLDLGWSLLLFEWLATSVLLLLPHLIVVVLQDTLARFRIRPAHLLRIAAYTAIPIVFWVGLIESAVLRVDAPNAYLSPLRFAGFALLLILPPALVVAWHYHAALKIYLQLPKAGRISLAAGLAGSLAMWGARFWFYTLTWM